jgi:hypothetical protein
MERAVPLPVAHPTAGAAPSTAKRATPIRSTVDVFCVIRHVRDTNAGRPHGLGVRHLYAAVRLMGGSSQT